jgi:hypothetical protein
MKKTALLLAGIISATILVVMGLGILLTGSFYFMPSITIDPFSNEDIDGNGMLVLTGTTNLGLNTHLLVNVSAGSGQAFPAGKGYITEIASILPGSGGRNSWKAALNVSSLGPGDYTIRVSSVTFAGNNWTAVPGTVVVTSRFRLGNESAGGNRALPVPFIIANTIGNRAADDTIGVTGTTNLPPGIMVLWKVDSIRCTGNGSVTGTPAPVIALLPRGNTEILSGTAGVNRWSFSFNSSGMEPGCYLVTVTGSSLAGNFPENTTENTVEFVLSGLASETAPSPSRFITVDAIPAQPINAKVVITGTTSLPAGEEFLVEITPLASRSYDFVVNPTDRSQGAVFAGVKGTVFVVPWSGDINLWSMDFDTYHLPPGDYSVNVSNSRVNRTTFRTEPGDVSVSGTFTVRGDAS